MSERQGAGEEDEAVGAFVVPRNRGTCPGTPGTGNCGIELPWSLSPWEQLPWHKSRSSRRLKGLE